MSIDPIFMNFKTKGNEFTKNFQPLEFDYSKYYPLKVNYVSNKVNAKSGKPYFQIIWQFADIPSYKNIFIYDNYFLHLGWKEEQFENLYRNWGAPHKCSLVEGKIAHAKLKNHIYNDRSYFAIDDIKEWKWNAEVSVKKPDLNDDIPF